ncbi:MAG: hypothetical protein IJO99_06705 [Ruminococcus sp.]|nr:hypothetical protein [Ruminococcus sp.]
MKNCKDCGCENTAESRFCKKCGALLDSEKPQIVRKDGEVVTINGFSFRPVPDEEIRALLNKKAPLWERIVAFVLVVAMIAGMCAVAVTAKNSHKKVVYDIVSSSMENHMFLRDGKLVEDIEYNGEISDWWCSDNCLYLFSGDNRIYRLYKDSFEVIAENVESYKDSFNGRGLFFCDKEGTGYLYNEDKNKSVKITEDINFFTVAVSPDGETVAYNCNDSEKMWIFDGKKSTCVDKGVSALAVSDDADRLYAVSYVACPVEPEYPDRTQFEDYDAYSEAFKIYETLYDEYEKNLREYELYVQTDIKTLWYYPDGKAGKRKKIADDIYGLCAFDRDIEEIIFYDSDMNTYYRKKNKKTIKLSDEIIMLNGDIVSSASVYDTDSLLNTNYIGKDALYFVDRKGKAKEIISGYQFSFMQIEYSGDKKKFCYDDGSQKIFVADKKTGDKERIAKNVRYYIPADESFDDFYVVNDKSQLSFVKNSGKTVKLDSNVEEITRAVDKGIYYISDEKLFYAYKDKTEAVELKGGKDLVCLSVENYESYVLAICYDNEEECYYTFTCSNDRKGFTEVIKGYSIYFFEGFGF